MKILVIAKGECVDYAAEELKKYIVVMSCGEILPTIVRSACEPISDGDAVIKLALLDELSLDTSDLDDPMIDDIIDVDIKDLSGYIAGSNQRSILMGVYRYCESAGVRYIRPGADGDYIPEADLYAHSFKMRKKADHPFRGECCEGAISYEHMRDTVYWLPKIGMNMYMIEGLVPYTYMHKWYGHVYNTKLRRAGQVTDYHMLEKYISRLERDVKRAGLQLHTLGHGWMFEKFGIHHTAGSIEAEKVAKLPDEQRNLLALVNGKRDLFANSTFFTHFCYSNPKARDILTDFMAEYAEKKPHVDFVHMWLADSVNNQCECEECRKHEPSDWYVMMLNELDEKLTAKNLDTKIVFIAYVDTIRPPKVLKLKNKRRFILLSAMGVFYEEGYKPVECNEPIPPYVRNKYVDFSEGQRMQCHKDWKDICGNIPSFIYEYRYYIDMYCDISHMKLSRETYRDMKALNSVNLEGCISDQTHRMYMPTSLPLITMGKTLFDKSTDFAQIKREHLEGSFGKDAHLVEEYLERLCELTSPSEFRISKHREIEEAGLSDTCFKYPCWKDNPTVADRAEMIPDHIDSFMPVIYDNIIDAIDPVRRQSWQYLEIHAQICRYHGRILQAGATGDMDKARRIFNELRDYISARELEFHNVFDLFLYLRAMSMKVGMGMPGYYE